jgi:hypothetical protein
LRQLQAMLGIFPILLTIPGCRRKRGESLSETLHPPTFLVDGYEEMGISRQVDYAAQLLQLIRGLEVAREKDHASHRRMAQQPFLLSAETGTLEIEHDLPQAHPPTPPARLVKRSDWTGETVPWNWFKNGISNSISKSQMV